MRYSFTVRLPPTAAPSFVISRSAEARAIEASYRERIIRYGEHGADAMREKAILCWRKSTGGSTLFASVSWRDTTASQVYTIRDIYPFFFADEIVRRARPMPASNWHFTRPPVRDLEFRGGLPQRAGGGGFVAAVTNLVPPHADFR